MWSRTYLLLLFSVTSGMLKVRTYNTIKYSYYIFYQGWSLWNKTISRKPVESSSQVEVELDQQSKGSHSAVSCWHGQVSCQPWIPLFVFSLQEPEYYWWSFILALHQTPFGTCFWSFQSRHVSSFSGVLCKYDMYTGLTHLPGTL